MGRGRKKFSKKPLTVPNKTVVWWDIDSCPVPDGVDPRCVRPSIESALKESALKKSCFGVEEEEVTIFAIGNLIRVPTLQNKAISSSGILMKHTHFGLNGLLDELYTWKSNNPPPATIMLITEDPDAEESCYRYLSNGNSGEGKYSVVPAYPTARANSWRWETLLKEETRDLSQMLEDKCTLPSWFCTLCQFESHTYPGFADHLYGRNHAHARCLSTYTHIYGSDHSYCLSQYTHLPINDFEIYQEFLQDRERYAKEEASLLNVDL